MLIILVYILVYEKTWLIYLGWPIFYSIEHNSLQNSSFWRAEQSETTEKEDFSPERRENFMIWRRWEWRRIILFIVLCESTDNTKNNFLLLNSKRRLFFASYFIHIHLSLLWKLNGFILYVIYNLCSYTILSKRCILASNCYYLLQWKGWVTPLHSTHSYCVHKGERKHKWLSETEWMVLWWGRIIWKLYLPACHSSDIRQINDLFKWNIVWAWIAI